MTVQPIADHRIPVETQAYTLRFDGSASPVLYLGEATPGSATSASLWRIAKIDTTSQVVMTWADGDTNFDNVWDNRASLSYS